MQRQKYHILLFLLSIPFIFTIYKGWWSGYTNWSSDAYKFLVLFACLAEIYFSKRRLVVAGMISIGVLLFGLLLHTTRWPGEKLFIFLGVVSLMIIPIWNAITTTQEKKLRMIISVWILLYGIGVLFKMFGWPGGGLLIILSYAYLPLVTIALGISLWKTKPRST